MSVWLVRAGEKGEYEDFNIRRGVTSIDYPQVPDLRTYGSQEALRLALHDIYRDAPPRGRAVHEQQLWAFAFLIEVGDIIVMPRKGDALLQFGRVQGPYEHRSDYDRGTEHSRRVAWLRTIPRSELDADLLASINSSRTIAKLERNEAERRLRELLLIPAALTFDVAPTDRITGDLPTRELEIFNVSIEQQHSEQFFVTPNSEPTEAERREAKLVHSFCDFLRQSRRFMPVRKQILPPGELEPLFTDIYVEELSLLVEAKGSTERNAFRMAVGQIADYRRFLNGPRCAILLPAKPRQDLLELAKTEEIGVVWPSPNGFDGTLSF